MRPKEYFRRLNHLAEPIAFDDAPRGNTDMSGDLCVYGSPFVNPRRREIVQINSPRTERLTTRGPPKPC